MCIFSCITCTMYEFKLFGWILTAKRLNLHECLNLGQIFPGEKASEWKQALHLLSEVGMGVTVPSYFWGCLKFYVSSNQY